METETVAAPKLSKAAVVGLGFSLLGLAFFPLSFLGFVLGTIGLIKARKGTLRGRGVAILAVVLAPLTVVTTGLEVQNLRGGMDPARMKESFEPRLKLPQLLRAVKAEQAKTGKLPAALPLTPSQAPCGTSPQAWPQDAAPGWSALGFVPDQPVRYSYEYVPDADGKSFTVRARGDLNCDGKTSLYEFRPGQLTLHTENELE